MRCYSMYLLDLGEILVILPSPFSSFVCSVMYLIDAVLLAHVSPTTDVHENAVVCSWRASAWASDVWNIHSAIALKGQALFGTCLSKINSIFELFANAMICVCPLYIVCLHLFTFA